MNVKITLTADSIRAGYSRRDIIDVPHLSIEPGVVTSLLGPNAAGKSTLVRVLSGALRPRTGGVRIADKDLYRLSARERARRLAYVGQENGEQFAFTVRELVRLGADANPAAPLSAAERVEEALDWLDLTPVADRDLLALSGGERQRASLARALAQHAGILILDEPTAHLDLRHQAAVMGAARRAAERGAVVLLVLHDLNLAGAFADRLILLSAGRIAGDGVPVEILRSALIASVYQTKLQSLCDENGNFYVHLAANTSKSARDLV